MNLLSVLSGAAVLVSAAAWNNQPIDHVWVRANCLNTARSYAVLALTSGHSPPRCGGSCIWLSWYFLPLRVAAFSCSLHTTTTRTLIAWYVRRRHASAVPAYHTSYRIDTNDITVVLQDRLPIHFNTTQLSGGRTIFGAEITITGFSLAPNNVSLLVDGYLWYHAYVGGE